MSLQFHGEELPSHMGGDGDMVDQGMPWGGDGMSASDTFSPIPQGGNRFEFASVLPTPFFEDHSHAMGGALNHPFVEGVDTHAVGSSSMVLGVDKTTLIASTVAGGVVAVALAVGLFMWMRKRRRLAVAEASLRAWDKEAAGQKYAAGTPTIPGLKPLTRPTTTFQSLTHSPNSTTTHQSAYHQRLNKTMSTYPRPDSVLTTHTDISMAPNVLGMVNGGAGGFGASWKQRTMLQGVDEEEVMSEYSGVVVEDDEAAGGWVDAEQVPKVHSTHVGASAHGGGVVSGRRPSSSAFEGLSWPRRGRVSTGSEVFGVI